MKETGADEASLVFHKLSFTLLNIVGQHFSYSSKVSDRMANRTASINGKTTKYCSFYYSLLI